MMKPSSIIMAFPLLCFAWQPALAESFAIVCEGTSLALDTSITPPFETKRAIKDQIYVIDEDRKLVRRALMPRQQFETVCELNGKRPEVDVSPGLVYVHSPYDFSPKSVWCSFDLDRVSGKLETELKINFEGGAYHRLIDIMDCKRALIPTFDSTKNKF